MAKMLKPLLLGLLLVGSPLLVAACDSGSLGANAQPGAGQKAAQKAGQGQDWTRTVVATADGGFRMGNPNAPVKLVEFASFTCVHCRDFHLAAERYLKPVYVRDGRVSYEYRPFMLNMVDVAAVQLATCEGPERFFTWANELYSNHDAWMKPFLQMNEQSAAPLRQLPADQQVRGFAELGGLNAFARPRGLAKAKFDQCLTDVKAMEAKAARQQEAVKRYDLMGTPSFLINGEKVDGVTTWSGLQPKLQQAIG